MEESDNMDMTPHGNRNVGSKQTPVTSHSETTCNYASPNDRNHAKHNKRVGIAKKPPKEREEEDYTRRKHTPKPDQYHNNSSDISAKYGAES